MIYKKPEKLNFYTKKEISIRTRETYEGAVRDYWNYLDREGLREGIESLESYFKGILNANTHNIKKAGIKAYYLKCFENESPERLLEVTRFFDKWKSKQPEQRKTKSDYITKSQLDELTAKSTDRVSCLATALFWSGCRCTELINIKLTDVSIKKDYVEIIVHGKGGKDRLVYLPITLHKRIKKVFKGKVFLFETVTGRKYRRENVTTCIHKAIKKILNENTAAHGMRHSKAMFLKDEKHLSPDQIAKALGHSSVITTMTFYFHGTPDAASQGIYDPI